MRRLLGRVFIALGGPQPPLIRYIFGMLAWSACTLLTFDVVFASIAARHFFADRFKVGLRFLAWSVQYGWLKKSVAYDPLFLCTLFLSPTQLQALAASVRKRRNGVTEWMASSDLICIYGLLAQHALLNGDRKGYEQWHALHANEASCAIPAVERIRLQQKRLAQEVGQQAKHVIATNADAALRDWADVCKSVNVTWFAVSGTLLGAVREQGWLRHDYDIDVGIMASDFPEQALLRALIAHNAFELLKFDRHVRFLGPDGDVSIEEVPACIKLVHRSGVPLDVFIHHMDGDVCWHGSSINRWNNSAFSLEAYAFRGMTMLGPLDYDRYLAENYGDWRTPVTNFHSTNGSGTPNLVLARNLFIIGLCIKRLVSVDEITRGRLLQMMVDIGAVTDEQGWHYNPAYCAIATA